MYMPRYYFNPSGYHQYLYLCGKGSEAIEAFHTHTYLFSVLLIRLPENSECCSFIENDQLVIISSHYLTRFVRKEDYELMQVATIVCQDEYEMDSNMAPAVDSVNGLLYIAENRVVTCFDWNGLEVKLLANFLLAKDYNLVRLGQH